MMAVGTIGVMIGIFELTGLGLKFATQVALIGETTLLIALLLAAASCLVLGMGMPTLPAYLVIVLVLGAAMKKLGIETLAVHLFVFYFGVLSAITPPVALAAVAAAPIAGAEPVRTGIIALRLSVIGFIVPFVFVYEPSLLLVVGDFNFGAFIYVLARLMLAMWLLNTAFTGYERARIGWLSRGVRIVAAFAMIMTIVECQIGGIVLGIAVIMFDSARYKTEKRTKTGSHVDA